MGAISEPGFFLNQQHLGPWGPSLTPRSLPGGVNPSPVIGNVPPSHAELTHPQTSLPPLSSILGLNLDPNPGSPALRYFGGGLYVALTSLSLCRSQGMLSNVYPWRTTVSSGNVTGAARRDPETMSSERPCFMGRNQEQCEF